MNPEQTLRSERIQIERKSFTLTLRENSRGRFLRITEQMGGRYATIIIPSTGLSDFAALLAKMVDAAREDGQRNQTAENP